MTTLTFGLMWPHPSRDHSTCGGPFPMGGPLWPCVYLAPLWRYGASNVGHRWTNARTDAQMIVILRFMSCTALIRQKNSGIYDDAFKSWQDL